MRLAGTTTSDVEVAVDFRADLGEGPIWDSRIGSVVWVDIPNGKVLILDPRGDSLQELDIGQPVGAVAPRLAGGYVLAVRDGFATLDPATGTVDLVAPVDSDAPETRMNDGICDRNGRFWAGTMAEDESPGAGALYRLDPDGSATKIFGDVTISNGIDWSPDGTLMYYIDTATQGVDAFDFDAEAGTVSGRRQLIAVEPEAGAPDGLTVDAEGFLWVALWGGGAVRRYAPDGALDAAIRLPATLITSLAFGGDDLEALYVSSAAAYLSPHEQAEQPHSGKLFRLNPGVRGRPANGFRG
jgi:sugar lactone lactonase YvrE